MTVPPRLHPVTTGSGAHGQRPRTLTLGGQSQVEQPLLGEVTADHLEADWQPVDVAGRDRDRRVAVEVGGGGEPPTLIQEADTAMYRSKAAGRNTVTMFDHSMRESIARRVELERMLRRALEHGDIQAWFQPIVSLSSGRLQGLEALARWEVDGRMISPADFIPVAEESGLIVPLGNHVLDEACRYLSWLRRPSDHAPEAGCRRAAVRADHTGE